MKERNPQRLRKTLLLKEAEKERNWHCRHYELCLNDACVGMWLSWSCKACEWKEDHGGGNNGQSGNEEGPGASNNNSDSGSGPTGLEESQEIGLGSLLDPKAHLTRSCPARDREWDDIISEIEREEEG